MTNKEIRETFGNEYIFHFANWEWGDTFMVMQKDGHAFMKAYTWFDEDRIYLSSLSVDFEYRNKGQATRLLQVAERIAKENGFSSLVLKTGEGSWMFDWYKRLGYVPFSESDDGLTWMEKSFAIVDTFTQTIH